MADVIEFLERMGRDAQLRHAPDAVLDEAMRDAQLSPFARAALMGGDRADIEAAIGAEGNVSCLVWAPEPEGEEKQVKASKAAIGIDKKVCCMVNVPLPEGDEESDGGKRQKAA